MCALNALQLKAKKRAEEKVESEEAAVEGEEGGYCYSGIVGQIYKALPSCIGPCQQACGPLAAAINAYMTKGG